MNSLDVSYMKGTNGPSRALKKGLDARNEQERTEIEINRVLTHTC